MRTSTEHRLLSLLISSLFLATLACRLPFSLFDAFVSPGDLDPEALATWEDVYEEEYDLEVYSDEENDSAPPAEAEPAPLAQPVGGQLTPQEQANEGTHLYTITGSSTPMLGNDGSVNDSGPCTSTFTEEGVRFQLQDYQVGFLVRVADNQYETVTEAGTLFKLTYTDTGLLFYSLGENGTFQDLVLTLEE